MRTSETLWEVFKATGRIGAYLLYKEVSAEDGVQIMAADSHIKLSRERQK
ncbi:MAG: YqzL family protein [Eubacteriales bacterium]